MRRRLQLLQRREVCVIFPDHLCVLYCLCIAISLAGNAEASPSYHPQTQSGFVWSGRSEPSSSSLAPVWATIVSTAFSTNVAPAAACPAAPVFDVEVQFVQPLQALFSEVRLKEMGQLSKMDMQMAVGLLNSFRRDVIGSSGLIESAGDMEKMLLLFTHYETCLRTLSCELVGFPEILQRLRDMHSQWAEIEGQARPQPPFAQIKLAEDQLHRLRSHLARANDARSMAPLIVVRNMDLQRPARKRQNEVLMLSFNYQSMSSGSPTRGSLRSLSD